MGGSREPVSETVMFSSLNWPPIRPTIFLKRLVYACPFLESMPTACTPPRRQLPRGERLPLSGRAVPDDECASVYQARKSSKLTVPDLVESIAYPQPEVQHPGVDAGAHGGVGVAWPWSRALRMSWRLSCLLAELAAP